MRFRRLVLVTLLLAGASALAVAANDHSRAATIAKCGKERWPIKTLTDVEAGQVNFTWVQTTVRTLRRLKRPEHLSRSRIPPLEFQSYRVEAELVTAIREDDKDIHLVITDADRPSARKTMIVELPDPSCTVGAFARAAITRARRDFERACGVPSSSGWALDGRATVTGVGFWDFDHNQTGVAPNAVELHPLVGFKAISCRRQRSG
jgi:hypothetical protein